MEIKQTDSMFFADSEFERLFYRLRVKGKATPVQA
jgi:hypothetical protein